MLGLAVPIGFFSIVYFIWQHRHQVLDKNSEGEVLKRNTKKFDLLKISILAIIIMSLVIGSLVAGFLISKSQGLNVSLQFLTSLGAGGIGLIIAIVIHWAWNKTSGVMGMVTKAIPRF